MNKNEVMNMMSASMGGDFNIHSTAGGSSATLTINAGVGTAGNTSISTVSGHNITHAIHDTRPLGAWGFWQDYYYPQIIRESYPVYIQERAKDNGKKAFEILKLLQDKKLLNVEKVSEFIEAMDSLIKVL